MSISPHDPVQEQPPGNSWSIEDHEFRPGTDGLYCVHCSLPRTNVRHWASAGREAA